MVGGGPARWEILLDCQILLKGPTQPFHNWRIPQYLLGGLRETLAISAVKPKANSTIPQLNNSTIPTRRPLRTLSELRGETQRPMQPFHHWTIPDSYAAASVKTLAISTVKPKGQCNHSTNGQFHIPTQRSLRTLSELRGETQRPIPRFHNWTIPHSYLAVSANP